MHSQTCTHADAAWASFANLAAALKNKLGKDVSHALKAQVVCVSVCECECVCVCVCVHNLCALILCVNSYSDVI